MIYGIDLDRKNPRVGEMSQAEANLEMEFFKVDKPSDLSDYDRKVFNSEKSADKYLEKYLKILNDLPNLKLDCDYSLPKMLYKRRYIIQTILKEKMQTYRNYDKGWKAGQKFQLYDQTYFLNVELISLTQVENNEYCYKFKQC